MGRIFLLISSHAWTYGGGHLGRGIPLCFFKGGQCFFHNGTPLEILTICGSLLLLILLLLHKTAAQFFLFSSDGCICLCGRGQLEGGILSHGREQEEYLFQENIPPSNYKYLQLFIITTTKLDAQFYCFQATLVCREGVILEEAFPSV